jgi:hypothetical protein
VLSILSSVKLPIDGPAIGTSQLSGHAISVFSTIELSRENMPLVGALKHQGVGSEYYYSDTELQLLYQCFLAKMP